MKNEILQLLAKTGVYDVKFGDSLFPAKIKSIDHYMLNGLDVAANTKHVSKINKVIFNDPATIVFWCDGTKTVVKAQNGEKYDPEKGLMAAITKKALGNKGNYYNVIEKWVGKYKEPATVYKMVPLTEEDELSIGEWKIRMTYYDQDGNVTGTGVYPRTYLYKTSAIRRAKQLWGDNPAVKWSVHLV